MFSRGSSTGILYCHRSGRIGYNRAVFTGRNRRFGLSGLVRAAMQHEQGTVLRWDPLFLIPLSSPAQELAALMQKPQWREISTGICLREPGDTLLVDNWRVLHGRSRVMASSLGRCVERVYLSEVSP